MLITTTKAAAIAFAALLVFAGNAFAPRNCSSMEVLRSKDGSVSRRFIIQR